VRRIPLHKNAKERLFLLTLGAISSAAATPQPLGVGFAATCDGLTPTITGGSGNDIIDGDSGADIIEGSGGDDTIDGGASGPDTVDGGTGTDTCLGDNDGTAVNCELPPPPDQ